MSRALLTKAAGGEPRRGSRAPIDGAGRVARRLPVKVTVIDVPNLPAHPSKPKWLMHIAVGLLAGLLIGAAFAVGRVKLDRTAHDPDEAMALTGATVIGTIIRDEGLAKGQVLA